MLRRLNVTIALAVQSIAAAVILSVFILEKSGKSKWVKQTSTWPGLTWLWVQSLYSYKKKGLWNSLDVGSKQEMMSNWRYSKQRLWYTIIWSCNFFLYFFSYIHCTFEFLIQYKYICFTCRSGQRNMIWKWAWGRTHLNQYSSSMIERQCVKEPSGL